MIKLNFWRRLSVNLIYLLGISIMILLPAFFALREIYNNIEFVEGNRLALNWAVSGALVLIVWAIIYVKYFRKLFHRKLQALAVRDEIGIMPVRGVIGMTIDRFLRTVEFVYPFVVTLLGLYVMKYAFGYQYEMFEKLYDMNIILLLLAVAGFFVMLIGDFVKVNFMQQQEVEDKLNLKAKTNKLELKELKKAKKASLAALAIERQLALLKEDTPEIVEPDPV